MPQENDSTTRESSRISGRRLHPRAGGFCEYTPPCQDTAAEKVARRAIN